MAKHTALSQHKSGRLDRIVRVRRPERDDDGKGMAMSDKNTRRATVKASEYENRMDWLDQSASKPPVAAHGAARRPGGSARPCSTPTRTP